MRERKNEKSSKERCEGDEAKESEIATRRESESDESERTKRQKSREIKLEAIKIIMEKMNGKVQGGSVM